MKRRRAGLAFATAPQWLPYRAPNIGELVYVRSRRWLVEDVIPSPVPGQSPLLRLACADDDNQGKILEVFWEYEPDRRILDAEPWQDLASRGFDPPSQFAAYYYTLRWNSVTATDPNLFQAPFRAGIKIEAYQMEPLRKALRLPRVNLFIADDTGLGKTIEAGLIARELLLRRKVKTIVISAPPSVLEQWRMEMEERFGLVFEILDRAYVARVRRERGFGVNPWRTHSRFLISHNLLIEPSYTDPMREWLGEMAPGSLFILDEAHHAAPATGNRYGIETKFTRAVRDLAGRFEHRLFLSATPHNGHSNSFSTLLEILDPHRFTRGVPVRGKRDLQDIMVRRLKEDIRAIQGGFPLRRIVRIVIDNLLEDAPELVLSRLLNEYRKVREQRFANASARAQAASSLLVVGLQQRLLSSIEAFARTLKVHRETVQREWERLSKQQHAETAPPDFDQKTLLATPGPDDENGALEPGELEEEEASQFEAATRAAEAEAPHGATAQQLWEREEALLRKMEEIAERSRYLPDAKTLRLLEWIRENMCPELPRFGERVAGDPPMWNNRRVIIFTESREGTRRYLEQILEQAIQGTDRAEERIAVIDGFTSAARRKEIQQRFNTDPSKDPLRILIATDAAREGLNFQAHCSDLFHFDLPWNPARIEQRNGRIDRKLQPEPEVRCHYFVLPQRVEDRVLEVLVRKTETIKRELGSLSKVIDDAVEARLALGIRHEDADRLAREIDRADLDELRKKVVQEELESARERQDELKQQIDHCRSLLERSREWVSFEAHAFRNALNASLELLGAGPLKPHRDGQGRTVYLFPDISHHAQTDPSWFSTLDTLRAPRRREQRLAAWRREAPIRPVVFEDTGAVTTDTVHLHLDHRVAQRLLARFRAQGFVYHDLSRACLAQTADPVPRVIVLGRLTLYGHGAERLHEEIVPVTARWVDPSQRNGPLQAYGREAEARTLELLERALGESRSIQSSEVVQTRLLAAVPQDVEELLPQLERRAEELGRMATKRLEQRGNREAEALREILLRQRRRVQRELERHELQFHQLTLGFEPEERRQLELNMSAWRRRLGQFEHDLVHEPERIRRFYEVRTQRVEPVGLVYLWPISN